jgi:chemotaxis signal transduction protein
MDKQDDSDKLLTLMRQHFADDPEENLERLHECTVLMGRDPRDALKKALWVLHNMKGSAQAVGFLSFAALLHDMEEVLGSMPDGPDADLAFSQLIEAVESYFQVLQSTLEDKPGLDQACRQKLVQLKALEKKPEMSASAGWGLFEDDPTPEPALEPVRDEEALEAKTRAVSGKYLLLEQNHRLFAIHLDEVKEIVSDHFLNPLPNPQKGLKGMIVVRNRALPVIDLGSAMDSHAEDTRVCAVICESRDQSFAFRVQKPRQVISLRNQDFENVAEKTVSQIEHQNLIKNVAKFNGQSVLIVDLKSMWTA